MKLNNATFFMGAGLIAILVGVLSRQSSWYQGTRTKFFKKLLTGKSDGFESGPSANAVVGYIGLAIVLVIGIVGMTAIAKAARKA